MVRCSVKGCKSDSGRKDENITFHRFPKELAIRTLWVNAIYRPNWDPTTYSRVCSKHFEAQSFQKTEKSTMLLSGSVPKLFLDDKTTEVSALRDDTGMFSNHDDSPRAKKLKEEIILLRKKSKEDGIKIKCLQNKIRRLLRKQGKSKETANGAWCQSLERRRTLSSSDEESSGSAESLPSPIPNKDHKADLQMEGVKNKPINIKRDPSLFAYQYDVFEDEDQDPLMCK